MTSRVAHPTRLEITRGTHVVFDSFMIERLSRLGAVDIVCTCESLAIGPSRRDGVEHTRARAAWWGEPNEFDRLTSPETRWRLPVIVWASTNLTDRLNLWKTCQWLRQKGLTYRDVVVIYPRRGGSGPEPHFNCTDSVCDHPDEVLLECLKDARSWSRTRYDRAVSLWNRFVDADPVPFVRTCIRGVKGFPELGPLWTLVASFFPRKAPDGSLRLSRFDDLLLTVLSAEWQTALAVHVHKSAPGKELYQLTDCTGDLFVPRRIEHWVHHGSSPAVERTPGSRPETELLAFKYRLTARGARLRNEGITRLTDGPPLPMAGTVAYSLESPWVLLDDGKLARL